MAVIKTVNSFLNYGRIQKLQITNTRKRNFRRGK